MNELKAPNFAFILRAFSFFSRRNSYLFIDMNMMTKVTIPIRIFYINKTNSWEMNLKISDLTKSLIVTASEWIKNNRNYRSLNGIALLFTCSYQHVEYVLWYSGSSASLKITKMFSYSARRKVVYFEIHVRCERKKHTKNTIKGIENSAVNLMTHH